MFVTFAKIEVTTELKQSPVKFRSLFFKIVNPRE